MLCALLGSAGVARAADIAWEAAVSGSYNDPTNWVGDAVPGPADRALITVDGTYSVTINTTTEVGDLILGGSSGLQTLNLNGFTLTLAGTNTVNVTGEIVNSAPASGGVIAPTSVINGVDFWGGGTRGNITVGPTGRLNIFGPTNASKTLNGTLNINNGGLVTWNSSASDSIFGDGAINILAGGVLKSFAPITATNELFSVTVNNAGTLSSESGILDMPSSDPSGTSSGQFNTVAGAILDFSDGQHILNAGASFNGPGLVRVNFGDLFFNGAGTVNGNFEFIRGNISGPGDLNVAANAVFTWTGGTMDAGGQTNIATGARLNLSGSGFRYLSRTLNNDGLTTMTGAGTLSGFISDPNGTFNNRATLSSAAGLTGTNKLESLIFNNTGTVEAQSGILNFAGDEESGTSSGIYNTLANATISFSTGAHVMNNVRYTGAGKTLISGGDLLIGGSNTVSGTLELTSGNLDGGNLNVAAGAMMNWSGGNMKGDGITTIAAGATLNLRNSGEKYLQRTLNNVGITNFTGSGTLRGDLSDVTGVWNNRGTFNSSTPINATPNRIFFATFNNFGAVNSTGGALQFNSSDDAGALGGVINAASGAFIFFADGTFDVNSGTRFIGTGLTRINGAELQFNGAAIVSGALELASNGSISGAAPLTVAANGQLNWTGGTMQAGGQTNILAGARLNLSGTSEKYLQRTLNNFGTANLTGSGSFRGDLGDAPGVFNNRNLFNSTAASTAINRLFFMTFNNFGTVNSNGGTLQFDGAEEAGNGGGTWNTASRAVLAFRSGIYELFGPRFTGAGVTRFNGATMMFNGAVNSLTTLELSAGEISGAGVLNVSANTVLNWTGGGMEDSGQTNIARGGVLNVSGANEKSLLRRINNFGVVNLLGAGAIRGDADSNDTFTNTAVGVVNTAPRIVASFREIDFVNGGALNVGETVIGTLAVNDGDFTNVSSGVLNIQLGGLAGTSFDKIIVGGRATLTGTLAVSPLGSFAPAAGNKFAFLSYPDGERVGTFARITSSGLSGGRVLRVAYNATNAEVVVSIAPTISSVSPTRGPVGTVVNVLGLNLGDITEVRIGTQAVFFTKISPTSLRFTVPATARNGRITVINLAGMATSAATFLTSPTLTAFTPSTARAGTVVSISGANFADATSVLFGGVGVPFTVVNPTVLRVTVPNNASSGRITVITPGGNASSARELLISPVITSLSPTSGPVATSVAITGTNFSAVTAVKFNGVAATFSVVSATQVRATVPAGATSGRVTLTTSGGTATSAGVFTVTAPVRPNSTDELASSVKHSSATASASKGEIRLQFTGALNISASDVNSYLVEINGVKVEIEGVSIAGNTVSLLLPENALRSNDRTIVTWPQLRDAKNRRVLGTASVVAR